MSRLNNSIKYDEKENEKFLVDLAKNGNKNAFKKLYLKNVKRVYAVCFRMTADPVKAEEITQDTFVNAWEKLKTFNGKSLFYTWLHRIAVNNVLIYFRKKKRRLKYFEYAADIFHLNKKAVYKTGNNNIDIDKAIALLPEKARMIFVLHDIEGYKHKEISTIMKISEGTSKAQLHRARKLLRESLER